ncbi:MAG: sulfatase [Lentisphaerales bacterium]|nr:sulfatase [Lentisphaerales bacterium]
MSRPPEVKPNVIVFFLDDSGYGDYTHNGNPTISTPNITKLTQEGVNFTQFYVTSPACSASRYSLLTGRYPSYSGLGGWVVGPGSKQHIHTKEITLAESFKSNGYATGIFGKWHLGTPNTANKFSSDALPLAHGFDEWIGTNVSHDYGNAMLIESHTSGEEPVKGYRVLAKNLRTNFEVAESLTQRCTEKAIKFIQKNKSKPFFAYVPYNMPHLGVFVSDQYKGVSRRGLLGDCMAEVDDAIGRIRQTVENMGLTENTIIVFASDNGPWVKFRDLRFKKHPAYGEARLHVGYAMPFRDGKGSTWEGGNRVPGIITWPGSIRGNRTVFEPASTLDLFPTLLSLGGMKLPSDRKYDGRDISKLLRNEVQAMPEPFCFFYHDGKNKPSALRLGKWKLHTRIFSQTGNNYGFNASKEKPLLFQVEQDISERIDRAAEQPKLVEKMLQQLESYENQIEQTGSFWSETENK